MFYLEPVEVSVQVAKETQTDDDGYLLPKSITDVQNFASDEYVKVDIEKESRKHDVTTTKENIGKERIFILHWIVINISSENCKRRQQKLHP